MPTWDAIQYLRFSDERARPCADLIARIPLEQPARIVDLGCGPGNSTEQLRRRWPQAEITGVDSSPEMLAEARRAHPDWSWVQGDVASWQPAHPYELVFSNSTLHWVKEHASVLPRLLAQVAAGGALAVQMPQAGLSPAHRAMVEVSQHPEWDIRLQAARRSLHCGTPEEYFDILAPLVSHLDIWQTTYFLELDGAASVLNWLRGSGMRPYLEALDEDQRLRFQDACLERFRALFPPRVNGKVLLPYPRIFLIARR
jgi:trans-aconitate 2-methyltransferase